MVYLVESEVISQLGLGNSQIRITETFDVFRLLIGFTTTWEGSDIWKYYSVEVKMQICYPSRKYKATTIVFS